MCCFSLSSHTQSFASLFKDMPNFNYKFHEIGPSWVFSFAPLPKKKFSESALACA